MSSWDYGVRAQVEEEYRDALAAGYCHLCASHKPDVKGQPCYQCQEDLETARDQAEHDIWVKEMAEMEDG